MSVMNCLKKLNCLFISKVEIFFSIILIVKLFMIFFFCCSARLRENINTVVRSLPVQYVSYTIKLLSEGTWIARITEKMALFYRKTY